VVEGQVFKEPITIKVSYTLDGKVYKPLKNELVIAVLAASEN
jgi:hypothetical protein